MRLFPLLPVALSVALLPACSIVYKLPTRQGNVVEQKQLDQLQVGMTREQVKFLMGTPIASSPFRDDRWDYFGYYKSPRGEVSKRNVTMFFESDKLTRVQGVQIATAEQAQAKAVDDPDFEALAKEKKTTTTTDHPASDRARDENPAGLPADSQIPSPEGSNLPPTAPR